MSTNKYGDKVYGKSNLKAEPLITITNQKGKEDYIFHLNQKLKT